MERLNLNIPTAARAQLKEIAEADGRKEGELARELFLDGLERARRDRFFDRVATSLTPKLQARLAELATAMERWRGSEG